MAERSVFVDAGRRGARKRWGQHQRNVSLAALDDDQRALVHAFVRMAEAVAAKKNASPVVDLPGKASTEVRRASDELSAA